MPASARGLGLSTKVLLLALGFMLLGEVLIFVPSIARFRLGWLEERITSAHLATLVIDPSLAATLGEPIEQELLRRAGVLSITLRQQETDEIVLGSIATPDRVIDLRLQTAWSLVPDAIGALIGGGQRRLRVIGEAPDDPETLVDVVVEEGPMWQAMTRYSARLVALSVALSLTVALLLVLTLQTMVVMPIRRISGALARFRERPEDAAADTPGSGRGDEIGFVEDELARLRRDLRQALAEKTRLAALGASMTRIGHDLRNILTTSVLISDRLERSEDPQVRKVAPRLIESLDRAVRLCAETLNYARSQPATPEPAPFLLGELVESVRAAVAERSEPVEWRVEVDPGIEIMADQDQLFRVLLNLVRNAYEAIGKQGGLIELVATTGQAGLTLSIRDTGPGIPESIKGRLFQPFAGSGKSDGNGLGLAIAHELVRAQGGDISLVSTSPLGTIFNLSLPARAVRRGGLARRRRMTMQKTATVFALLALPLAACSYQGPSFAGVPGLQYRTISYYNARAWEENATCPQPRMSSVFVDEVLEETPERLVVRARYRYRDDGQRDDDEGFFGLRGNPFRCEGWGERVFTFAKRTDGTADPIEMTGPQRDRAVGGG